MKQKTFILPLDYSFSEKDFIISDSNKQAFNYIKSWGKWQIPSLILYGEEGSGKTHLAHIWAKDSGADFININNLGKIASENLLGNAKFCIIDGLEQAVNISEKGLFHLLNLITEKHIGLIIASRKSPYIELKDLSSRLACMVSQKINSPDDKLMQALLIKLFADKQLQVSSEVIKFIIPRIERSYKSLQNMVNKIDIISLQQKRNITVPFIQGLIY